VGTAQVVTSIGVSPATAVTPVEGATLAWERQFQVDRRIQASLGPAELIEQVRQALARCL